MLHFADGGIELSLAGGGGKSTQGKQTVADHVDAMPGDTALLLAFAIPSGAFDALEKADPDGMGSEFFGSMLGIDFPEDLQTLLGKSISISVGGDAPDDLATIDEPGDLSVGALINGDADAIEEVIAKLEQSSGATLEDLRSPSPPRTARSSWRATRSTPTSCSAAVRSAMTRGSRTRSRMPRTPR